DGARGDVCAQRCNADVEPLPIENQTTVDLVRGDDQIVLFCDARQRTQLFTGENAPDGIVRIAEQQQASAWRDGRFDPLEIPGPLRSLQTHRHARDRAPLVRGPREKRVIDRYCGDDVVAVVADGARHQVDPGYQAGQPHEPILADLPAVVAFQG